MAALADGVIEAGKSYGLERFKSITGLGKVAMRTARRNGLKVRYVGGRAFVLGDDWLQYVREHGEESYR